MPVISHAVGFLKKRFDIPIIGVINPGAEAAVKYSQRKIGIIGTTATINSGAYKRSILEKNPNIDVISRDCPLLVPIVEEGWLEHKVTRLVLEESLIPVIDAN